MPSPVIVQEYQHIYIYIYYIIYIYYSNLIQARCLVKFFSHSTESSFSWSFLALFFVGNRCFGAGFGPHTQMSVLETWETLMNGPAARSGKPRQTGSLARCTPSLARLEMRMSCPLRPSYCFRSNWGSPCGLTRKDLPRQTSFLPFARTPPFSRGARS